MAKVLFLLSPVLMGGFCLLVGETLYWAKGRRHHKGLKGMHILFTTGRK